jgi:N6-L-threonylcarbamoyladenine synthase
MTSADINDFPCILAVETSCDETSASVICKGNQVLSNIVSSQIIHSKYGGVIPELASRAHMHMIHAIVQQALEKADITMQDIQALAVTAAPGLAGALLVGTSYAKGLALRYNLPLIPVHHIEGHLYSAILEYPNAKFPFISLVVSGGHTSLFLVESFAEYHILGSTKDDAAGEAFDKIAKMLGLGYPGGPMIDKLAASGKPDTWDFPRSMMHDGSFNFSFSGLKTSVRYFLEKNFAGAQPGEQQRADICASVQAAITDVLIYKTIQAARKHKVKTISISGGVSANSALRHGMQAAAKKYGMQLIIPRMSYCTDNAAMIGFLAAQKFFSRPVQQWHDLSFTVHSQSLRARREAIYSNEGAG